MKWTYQNTEIETIDQMPEGTIGFIYKITNEETGEYYIGKKSIYQRRTLPPLKGYKRKRKVIKESKWQQYRSSNDTVKEWNEEHIKLEILRFCKSKKSLTYYELQEQFSHDVLADPLAKNDNLLGKFYKRDLENTE
jgi:hypothetical protein